MLSIDKTTRNALQLMAFWGSNIPVARGTASSPVHNDLHAAQVHGESGMEGYPFPEPDASVSELPAPEAICRLLENSPEPVTLVTIGPLINIARLIEKHPDCLSSVRQLVMMGGSSGRGNTTPYAEFNIVVDPEAAACVFGSGLDIVMCGLDVTNQATLTPAFLELLPSFGRTGTMLHALFSHYRSGSMRTGLRMHDLTAIAWLVHPEFFRTEACYVAVETSGEFTRGATVIWREEGARLLPAPANARVVLDVDVDRFRVWVATLLAQPP